jgi:hypothetical protein
MQLYKQPDTSDILYVLFTAPIPVRPSRSVCKKPAVTVQIFQHKSRSSWGGKPVEIVLFLIPKIRHLSYSKDERPSSDASSSPASQEISRTSWKSKVHCLVHNSSSLVRIPSHINPLHALPSYFLQLRFNIIILSMPWSFKWSLFLRFPDRKSLCIPLGPHTCHTSRQSHSPWFGTRIIFGKQHRSWRSSLCSLLQCPVTSALSDPNTFLNTVNLCSSLNVTGQFSHQ